MKDFDESRVEYADFVFDCEKVVCYGLQNAAGGATTVLNFPTVFLAQEFRGAFLQERSFDIIENDAQLICLADYNSVVGPSCSDPRVRALTYDRDFMMGTLAHLA